MISQKSCASLILSSCGSAFAALRISVALMAAIYSFQLVTQAGGFRRADSTFNLQSSAFSPA
jgi:hypothetical protein